MTTYPEIVEARIGRVLSSITSSPQLPGRKITTTLADRMHRLDVPGVSIAVINEGQIEWARGFGVMEYGKDNPVSPETLFQAASISKPTTGLATLRLVSEGVLDLDRDVNTYLKSWKVPSNGKWQPRLTLRHIMSHSAGTTVHGFPGYPRGRTTPTLTQVLSGQYPANTPPVIVDILPGTQIRYSGGGTSIMQQLLEDVTGLRFAALMKSLVLEPLGMDHSTFEQPLPERLHGTEATGHWSRGEPIGGKWHVYPEQAAAGLWTTPTDLCKMIISIQQARAGKAHRFLSRHVIDEALTPQFGGAYGLGFRLEGSGAELRFGHSGANAGFKASVSGYAGKGLGACVMTNGDNGTDIYTQVLVSIAEEYGWSGYLPSESAALTAPVDVLSCCAGTYEIRPGLRIVIDTSGSELLLSLPGQDPIVFMAESPTEFRSPCLNTVLRFELTGEHKVAGVQIVQGETVVRAARL